MRARILVFAALVAIALALNLARLSLSVAQTGEDTLRARLATATSALKAQLELVDARLSPRAVAEVPDLIEATRAPADPTQPLSSPDERALRAAASALSPEPDLVAVANPQGAMLSRRTKPAVALDDPAKLPLAKAALEGNPAPAFAAFDGAVYRLAGARVPGNAAVAVVGTLVDDRFAQQIKSQIDADVTLLQAGKVVASSLPQGEERARVLRWAAAPAPGYGVLRVNLPYLGPELSGKLPRGAARFAVRGALAALDSGMQAALTVPASPYFGWLARYQAFYLLGLALFVLFSLVWALLARAPAPVVERVQPPARPVRLPEVREEAADVSPPRPARRPSPALVGADIGEPRSEPPPKGEVPWTPPEEAAPPPPRAERAPAPMESLDPEVPAPVPLPAGRPEKPAPAQHPMWAADPFTPTPAAQEPEPVTVSAEEVGLVEAEPEAEAVLAVPEAEAVEAAPEPPAAANGQEPSSSGDFSFAGLLDEARGQPAPASEERPSLAQDYADTTEPGKPTDELLAEARSDGTLSDFGGIAASGDAAAPVNPGDEPTRVEAVSAALLDKLRERDDDTPAPAPAPQQGWGSLVGESDEGERTVESMPPEMPAPAPEPEPAAPETSVTMQDFSLPAAQVGEEQDPDEVHWRETFDRFKELKTQLGEPADKISFEKFAAKLRKNRADLLAKHNCKGVRFSVYEKEGKAAIKASAIR